MMGVSSRPSPCDLIACKEVTEKIKIDTSTAGMIPKPGESAPNFASQCVNKNGDVCDISLSDFRGKILVLIFYQCDFVRETQDFLMTFSGLINADDNLAVAACSVDSVFAHSAWRKQFALDYPLIADKSRRLAGSFGVLDQDEGHAENAAFIVDAEGKIRYFLIREFAADVISQLITSIM